MFASCMALGLVTIGIVCVVLLSRRSRQKNADSTPPPPVQHPLPPDVEAWLKVIDPACLEEKR